MTFSIIVPVYNASGLIRNCLNSILAQTFTDFEVIVIDDGSTDNSSQIVNNEYVAKDKRVNCFSFKNSGVGFTRRRGISLSNGEYLLFVDSDDTINPELLESIYPFIVSATIAPDLIRYQCNIVNDESSKDHERYNFNPHMYLNGLQTLKLWSIPGKKYAVYWLFCFKRTVFTQVLFVPSLKCYEDVALIPLLVANACSVITIDYIGYNYTYDNSLSLTHVRTEEAERARAFDFFDAYDFAIRNFFKLDNITSFDIAFFIRDYNRRLRSKFESLPDSLKEEFREMLTTRLG